MEIRSTLIAAGAALALAGAAQGVTVPFTETFATDESNWRLADGVTPMTWLPGGGPDGSSYANGGFNFTGVTGGAFPPTVLRGHDSYGSSGGNFTGDWLAAGVTELSLDFRHDAPVPLNFNLRIAAPDNSPGASVFEPVPVLPNVWTSITIPIDPSNPQFVSFGGSDFTGVFSEVGNFQVGVGVPFQPLPPELANQNITVNFDLDNISVIPSPGVATSMMAMGLLGVRRRRG